MKLTGRFLGPPQITAPTPASHLIEFLAQQAVNVATRLRTQLARGDIRMMLLLVAVGIGTEALWLYFVPFAWGWDSTANLAIGRMYFGLPYQMWSIKLYYPPGYPIFLTLLGLHHLDTLTLVKIGTLFVGGLMPLLLFLMLRRFNRNAALLAALIFAAGFGHALFSTDMMNHHFHAFLLLLMSVALAYHLYRPSNVRAVLFGCTAAMANTGRDVTMFIFAIAVLVLFVASWIEQRNVRAALRNAVIMIASFVVVTGSFSVARVAALGEPFRFGLTYDIGARALFQGAYYGASIYQKEFRPGEDFVFVKPENGPASKEFFEMVRAYFAVVDLKGLGLSDTNDPDEAVAKVIANPNVRNTYTFWWGMDTFMAPADSDRLWRDVVVETIVSQPRILRYYVWNFWTYLFGLPLVNEGNCVICTCPPCFAVAMPQSYLGGFMGAEVFSKAAGPGVIAEMRTEHERAKRLEPYARYLYADARLLYVAKPLLTVLLLASVFLARGKTRILMIYCVLAVAIIGGTTSLAWPVQGRYQYPALPYVLAGAAISILEVVRRTQASAQAGTIKKARGVAPWVFGAHSSGQQEGLRDVTTPETRGTIIQATIRHAVTNMDDRGFIRVIINDAELWLPPATIRTMTHCFHMEETGRFMIDIERPQLDWLASRLAQGSHFIDVGAATGAVCLPLARKFGQSISIIAFEPAKSARELLAATAERNGLEGIRILPFACSDRPGHATFYEFPQDEGDTTPFLPEASTLAPISDPRANAVVVEVTTLDAQFDSDVTIRNAAVKIDVEGFEAKVLAGGLRFFARVRPALAIDIHANPFGTGTTEDDVRKILSPLGYRFGKLGHVLTCSA